MLTHKQLLNSKWTAVKSINKQKHFLVTDVEYDEDGVVTKCEIQAIINKEVSLINWRDLANKDVWLQGWK